MNYQTAKEIEFACIKRVWNGGRYLVIPNVKDGFFRAREADLLIITPSDYCFEIEIKISLADFKNDFKKHILINDMYVNDLRIKRKTYAVPEELYMKGGLEKLLPDGMGLWAVSKRGIVRKKVKPENKKGARKLTDKEKNTLMRLGCLRLWGIKEKSIEIDNIKKDIKKVLGGEDIKILKQYIEKKKYW